MTAMRVLGLIPARGGSKGVPRKNLRLLHGRPLLAYTAEAARSARSLDRVVLSTDDPEIADLGVSLGLDVPFLRPPELAEDETPMLPVVQHAVRLLEARGYRYDAVCLLQPTNPLRGGDLVDACVARLASSGADSVVTVLRVPPEHNPHWVYFENGDGFLTLSMGAETPISRRQLLPPAYHREGSVYVTRRRVVVDGDSLYGARVAPVLVDEHASVNVDTMADFERAERLLAARV
jgi:CMP-N-acetylneuraminic acid synthetase